MTEQKDDAENAKYIAYCALSNAIQQAISERQTAIKQCGELSNSNSLSASAKGYFTVQLADEKRAIDVLKQYHKEVFQRKWDEVQK